MGNSMRMTRKTKQFCILLADLAILYASLWLALLARTGSPPGAASWWEHALAFSGTIIHEDTHAKVIKVKTKNPNRTWGVVYTLTYEGVMQRNGTAIRWSGTDAEGNPAVVSGVAVKGGCISCSRR